MAWGEWTNLQGVLTAAPAVISGEDGSVDVLARGVDRRVYPYPYPYPYAYPYAYAYAYPYPSPSPSP